MSGQPPLPAGDSPPGARGTERPAQTLDLGLAGELRRAQAAILSRPRLSIRLRLVASLALCFLLCGAFAVAAQRLLGQVWDTVHRLQSLERLGDAIGQVQVSEKSGLLLARDVRRVLHAVQEAEQLLRRDSGREDPANPRARAALLEHLGAYRRLLAARGVEAGAGPVDARVLTARTPRERAEEATIAGGLPPVIAAEQAAVQHLMTVAQTGPLVLLGFLLALFALITYFFADALVGPIRRFQAYTKRIAAGDFTLIEPARTYRDEFSDLALAVNQMLAELHAHQDRCVKAGKLAAVGTITSGIAHELNNPLNNISITTEALMEDLRTLSDDEKWRLLQDIYFETERATEIVRSLLDFTRYEKPELVPLDLADVIQSTVRLAQNEMTINNVDYACDLPADLPRVRAATNQLRQVFLNLFLNAIQAMPNGGRLTVSAATHEAGKVCAEVVDEGVGIPPEVLPHIFDPFFTTKEPGKGTGLGLSVSYNIIKKFGGDIQVTSEVGRGTRFHLCLPVADAP